MRTIAEYEATARERLEPAHYDYFAGGAQDEITLRENEEAYKRLRLIPRVLRGSDKMGSRLGPALDSAVRGLDALGPEAARARGEARDDLMRRVALIEEQLSAAAVDALDPSERTALEREADAELEPFRARMPDQAYRQSRRQALHSLVRQHFGLPSI